MHVKLGLRHPTQDSQMLGMGLCGRWGEVEPGDYCRIIRRILCSMMSWCKRTKTFIKNTIPAFRLHSPSPSQNSDSVLTFPVPREHSPAQIMPSFRSPTQPVHFLRHSSRSSTLRKKLKTTRHEKHLLLSLCATQFSLLFLLYSFRGA